MKKEERRNETIRDPEVEREQTPPFKQGGEVRHASIPQSTS